MARNRRINFYAESDYEREVGENSSLTSEPYRSEFRRDYGRLIHSPAFRRLQGKTQLFPGDESDFFRNRITHSLEVAQIAKSIALRLNRQMQDDSLRTDGIDTNLVEFAALAHDLGHPPFGHTGEHALDSKMRNFGGFEGNAQTLRILTRLEKKRTKSATASTDGTAEFEGGEDLRAGLNITGRSLASIIKYDHEIPFQRSSDEPLSKGYYASEAALVENIKNQVMRGREVKKGEFQTVEMQIMDLADDIAYSTYDFEDALKAQFTSPLDLLLEVNSNEDLRDVVASKLFKSEHGQGFSPNHASESDWVLFKEIKRKMEGAVIGLFFEMFLDIEEAIPFRKIRNSSERSFYGFMFSLQAQKMSRLAQTDGYSRTALTSEVVGDRIQSVSVEVDSKYPALSRVVISDETRFSIDVMKYLTYEIQIRSPRLRIIEERGKQIVTDIFECLSADHQGDLLPDDWRSRMRGIRQNEGFESERMRLISGFIAGMTDNYALQFHSRLKSSNPSVLFRPI